MDVAINMDTQEGHMFMEQSHTNQTIKTEPGQDTSEESLSCQMFEIKQEARDFSHIKIENY